MEKMPRENTTRTRQNLLEAATALFAEKGYPGTTIAEICKQAGANTAAVNYHFRNKETLYAEAWRSAFRESLQKHPPDGGISAGAPPETRLRALVLSILRRFTDKNNRAFWFMQREFANPTGLLEEVVKEEIKPLQEQMERIVRELLGTPASDRDVKFCKLSIIGQCFNTMVMKNRLTGRDGENGEFANPEALEAYAEHIVKFSLAGIRELRGNMQL